MKKSISHFISFCVVIGLFFASSIAFTNDIIVDLTPEEIAYIKETGPIKMVVDPDWYPYEHIDSSGNHRGIAAELIALVAARTGLVIELVPTADWSESIEVSKANQSDIISLLNATPERSKWLIFTDPYYQDPNVIITREEHDYVSDLSRLSGEIMVLPIDTSIEERVRKDFPHLNIVLVETEAEAIAYVSSKKADLTLRSLTMAAYTIKSQGLFNLKIAGQIPEYTNAFRIGVSKDQPLLRDILNKGIATITPEEVQTAINNHIALTIESGFNYSLFFLVLMVLIVILIVAGLWNRQLSTLNHKLSKRQEALTTITEQLAISEEKYKSLALELERSNAILNEKATIDKLTGIKNRYYFDQRINDELIQSERYGTHLSLLFFDLDKFKDVNDNFGHDVGDQVLMRIANTVEVQMRKTDVFARWGGEEFVVLLTQTNIEHAKVVADKILHTIGEIVHPVVGKVTVSIGLSEHVKNESLDSWFKRTDHAMYSAKNNGRNQVSISENSDVGIHLTIQWHPSWECGNAIIDTQHKELLSLGNLLIEDSFNKKSPDHLSKLVDRLLDHVVIHFSDEEKILQEIHYEDLHSHTNKHHELIEKASHLKTLLAGETPNPAEAIEFVVNTVITNHLLKEDVKYFHHFKNKKA